ncbi:hypothetical protein B0H16DRAFT_425469 [Mycena metata]|uniref:Zn(2)-C6 fungal-type domain-containing protein n=1 Tax=Mycena metata TaxID=1033252 RepID=A0AAD7HDH9_9AGAR|nr:hypothetical protein B0H16DRAFT_425469 [Mycena metata]
MASKSEVRKSSCKACHQRRVRCDGQIPCGSCSRARKPIACEYLRPAETSKQVPRGTACLSCRKRKRKCDGKRPCSTCKDASQPDACQYPYKAPRREHEDSGPPNSGLEVHPHHPWAESVKDTMPTNSNNSSILVLAPNLGRPLHGIDHNNERYLLRTLFVDRSIDYGLDFTAERREAIARGDTSGGVIHPIFIHLAQLMGYLVADTSASEHWAHLRGQTAKEMEQRLQIVKLLKEPGALDPLTSLQVLQTLALYWVRKRDFRAFEESLGAASDVSMVLCPHATESVDESLRRVGLSQELVHEGRSALANIIFIQVISLTLVPAQQKFRPTMLVKLHHLLTYGYDRFNWNHVRARAALFFEQARQLVTKWNDCDSDNAVGKEWNERSRRLANEIQAHLHVLDTALRTVNMATKGHVAVIKVCGIVSLAALAGLHAVLAPFDAVARQKHRKIVEAIASITRTLAPTDHEGCDFLEVCWEIASREISEQTVPTEKWRRYRKNVGLSESCLAPPQVALDWTDSALFEEVVEAGQPGIEHAVSQGVEPSRIQQQE